MYQRSARLYDALNRHKDYEAAASAVSRILQSMVGTGASLLDVACGTGRHLEYLRDDFRVAGLDQSADMLAIAAERCPGIPLHVGDLCTFRLDRRFDAMTCLFGSIAYAATHADLDRALTNMVGHLNDGGALVIEPWLTPDRFVSDRPVFDHVDDPEFKVARMYVTRREGRVSVYDMDYLVAIKAEVTHFTESERLGLFTREEYLDALERAGVTVSVSHGDLFGYGLLVGTRKQSP